MGSSDASLETMAPMTRRMASGSRWLPAGAVAACADALLGAVAAYVSTFTAAGSRAVGPIDLGEALGLATVLPEAVVLAGLFFVARDVAGSLAMWRGSVGFFGCFWLLQLLGVAEWPGWWQLVIGLTVLAGIVLIVAAVFARPWVMAEPVAEPLPAPDARGEVSPGAPAEKRIAPPVLPYAAEKKPSDWSWLWVGIALVVGRRVLGKLGVTFEDGVAFGGLLLMAAALGFLVWLGVTKLGLTARLGRWAAASGWADLALAAGSAGMMAWVMWVVVVAEVRGEGEVTDDDPRLRTAELAWEALSIVWKLTLAGLLGSAWRERKRSVSGGGGA
jgi:hypothetical protein